MWEVRKPDGRYIGPFGTHADALKAARRIPGGGTPVEIDANGPKRRIY